MARDTGCTGQVVVVVNVAIRTLTRRHGMRSRQHEAGAVVVEGRVEPRSCVVALVASLREIRGHVVRIRRALEILQVAGNAGRTVQRVVVVDVAVRASPRRNRMHAGQSESGRGVIKLPVSPLHGVMALLTGCRKSGMRHRRCRVVVVVLMARDTRRTRDVVVVVDMAVRTLTRRDRMRSRQRKSRF